MKFIQKNPEPEGFSRWKEQEADNLERYFQRVESGQMRIKDLWRHLPGNLSNSGEEEGGAGFSKNELLESLLSEQGFICAYCSRTVHKETLSGEEGRLLVKLSDMELSGELTQEEKKALIELRNKQDTKAVIEHVEPKSQKERLRHNMFRYENLVASCLGGEKIPKPKLTSCNCKKLETPIPLSPLHPDCESRIGFGADGTIFGFDDDAERTIDVLGLSIYTELRKRVISGFLFEDRNSQTLISREAAEQIVEALSAPRDGRYMAFCNAVINVLKRDILGE